MEYIYLTQAGLDKAKSDLHEAKVIGRKEAAHAIAEARDKGDLSENAEYDAAKEAQGMLEKKISELEDIVARARVIDESKLDTSKAMLLSKVEVKNMKVNKVFTYQLVSAPEADFKTGKISIESPIGKGLLGKKVGEIAEITVPAGQVQLEILSISF